MSVFYKDENDGFVDFFGHKFEQNKRTINALSNDLKDVQENSRCTIFDRLKNTYKFTCIKNVNKAEESIFKTFCYR